MCDDVNVPTVSQMKIFTEKIEKPDVLKILHFTLHLNLDNKRNKPVNVTLREPRKVVSSDLQVFKTGRNASKIRQMMTAFMMTFNRLV